MLDCAHACEEATDEYNPWVPSTNTNNGVISFPLLDSNSSENSSNASETRPPTTPARLMLEICCFAMDQGATLAQARDEQSAAFDEAANPLLPGGFILNPDAARQTSMRDSPGPML